MEGDIRSAIRAVGGPTVFTAPIDSLIQSSSSSSSSTTTTTSIITIDSRTASGYGLLVIPTDVVRETVCYRGVGLYRGLRRVTGDGLVGLTVMGERDV